MMIRTACPLGGSWQSDVEAYPASFDMSQVNADIFSARRLPDRIHYRMVRNAETGCLRADPILDDETLLKLYGASRITYADTAPYAADTYARYLQIALPYLPDRRAALEIGCGHGFFLERLLSAGFESVSGVEPSLDAADKAPDQVKRRIVCAGFTHGLFDQESFSLVCGFQVLDHLVHPNEALAACWDVLMPGGVMYWICHDVGSPLARVLGERNPMIDIQHVVLYDRQTVARLFQRNGFEVLQVFGVSNRYPLSYWVRLAPMPAVLKNGALRFLEAAGAGRLSVMANFGNMGILARKPAQ